MGKKKKRIDTTVQEGLSHNPFAGLDSIAFPEADPNKLKEVLPSGPADAPIQKHPREGHRGRVDIVRQKAHRGGKTVTVITQFVGISMSEKESLARSMQKTCGVGGTVKNGDIEIQGDQREAVAQILSKAGFRPVFAGG
tara:strand:+ start:844 stop:1260 length:417 start_codon:yes stop_codon:yes gene_type:complete